MFVVFLVVVALAVAFVVRRHKSIPTVSLSPSANDDSGQDLLEYALLVALIALVSVAAITYAGEQVNIIFKNVGNQLAGAV